MPAYHSQHGLVSLEPRDSFPVFSDVAAVTEEALQLFKANSFYPSFDVQCEGDTVLVYLHRFIGDCLRRLSAAVSKEEAQRLLAQAAVLEIDSSLFREGTAARCFVAELRKDMAERLCKAVYREGTADSWWLCFQKRKVCH